MSKYVIAQPPQLTGEQEQDMRALYSYLYRMNENLQVALSSLNSENFTETGLTEVRGVSPEQQAKSREQEIVSLRSLIIKTADTVRSEMDRLEMTLRGEYVAVSDFGTYTASVQNEIEATATGILQSYHFSEQIEALQAAEASFADYQQTTEAYIKSGLLYMDGDTPVHGVAVGKNLTTQIVDGVEEISRYNLCAMFTADRLSFWQGGVEIAYLSNNRLHIAQAEVDTMNTGSWRIGHTDGFSIEWVG